MKVQERFLKYISVDTTSDPSSDTFQVPEASWILQHFW